MTRGSLATLTLLAWVLLSLSAFLFSLSPPSKPEENLKSLIIVPTGTAFRAVATNLEEQSLLRSAFAFEVLAALTGARETIQSGEYEIDHNSSALDILTQLVEGDVKTYTLTLIEGQTLAESFTGLHASEGLTLELTGPDDPRLLSLTANAFDRTLSSEGLFMPDTYEYRRGDSDIDLLRRAHALLLDQLSAVWESKAARLPLKSPYEALILASIIERESGLQAERARIAGVFANRLHRGMRLQSDPTTIYGLGASYDGALTKAQLRGSTAFNTYTINGLPPTPIALSSLSALKAAVRPEDHNYLYFVADGEGGHVFSETLEQHNQAVRRYRQTLSIPDEESRGQAVRAPDRELETRMQ